MQTRRGVFVAIAAIFLVPALLLTAYSPRSWAQDQPQGDLLKEALEMGMEPKGEEAQEEGEGEFHYNPAGKRDPFKSLLSVGRKTSEIPLEDLPPIQRVELKQLKIMGIISDEAAGARAMMKGPDGNTHMVVKGDLIGKNQGEVLEVNLDGVRVVETFLDFLGQETKKETFIESHPKKK